MVKEDILAKSRKEKKDEGMEYIENHGRRVGFMVFLFVVAFLLVFSFFYGESDTFHAVLALLWIFIATEGYAKYHYLKSKGYLVTAITSGLASFAHIVSYVLKTLG